MFLEYYCKIEKMDILDNEKKERKRKNDRVRAKKKYEEWKKMPPDQRTPSYYERNKEVRKAYARKYYYEHRNECLYKQKLYNERKKRIQHI